MPTKEKKIKKYCTRYRPSPGDAGGEIRIEMRVKNSRLYEAIVPMFGSIAEFCRRSGMKQIVVGGLINFKRSPFMFAKECGLRAPIKPKFYSEKPMYTVAARRLAEICGYSCADLFPFELYEKVTNNFMAKKISMHRLLADEEARIMLTAGAPHDHEERLADTDAVSAALQTLPSRHAEIIRQSFGFTDGMPRTHDEVAKGFSVTRERVRQIEDEAIRRLRHPRRRALLLGGESVGQMGVRL